ncbi:hypothetical protein Poli38472_010425 [Pythium oligandrum]|uniref:Uncharacterized protein n=1 Tax=Pythium oligandrum TaxID=41045 RepID=A0A8K1FE59_PYTOL|nr:hypothetical protein Poli38472_010425 [Pythium oligandrum]|eukprot:TMW55543.1 hypothetical protein Poli38472_010425 [Pythium oligandrum]
MVSPRGKPAVVALTRELADKMVNVTLCYQFFGLPVGGAVSVDTEDTVRVLRDRIAAEVPCRVTSTMEIRLHLAKNQASNTWLTSPGRDFATADFVLMDPTEKMEKYVKGSLQTRVHIFVNCYSAIPVRSS